MEDWKSQAFCLVCQWWYVFCTSNKACTIQKVSINQTLRRIINYFCQRKLKKPMGRPVAAPPGFHSWVGQGNVCMDLFFFLIALLSEKCLIWLAQWRRLLNNRQCREWSVYYHFIMDIHSQKHKDVLVNLSKAITTIQIKLCDIR